MQRLDVNHSQISTMCHEGTHVKQIDFGNLKMEMIHYIAKSIHSPIQIIKFRCSNHFHGHGCINAST